MTRMTHRERLEQGVKLATPPDIPLVEEYVQIGARSSKGNALIEMFGRAILEVPQFRQRCIDALPKPPSGGTVLLSNPVLMELALLPLSEVVYPTPNLCRMYPRVLGLIAKGYVRRPLLQSREHASVIHMLSTTAPEDLRKLVRARPPSLSLMIIGTSGMGKSYGLEFTLGHLPQARRHVTRIQAIQILWLHVECPPTGTLKALLLTILLELDQIVGTTYYWDWLSARVSTDVLLINVVLILFNHNLGVLVLDELQHLAARGFAESDANLNFFVALMNFLRIPLISVGTYAALSVLNGRLRDGRRLSSEGTLDFPRFEKDEAIAKTLQDYYFQFLPNLKRRPLTPEFHEKAYDVYQGLHFLLPNLVQRCGVECSYRGEDHVSDEILRYYREVELAPISAALDALASNDPDEIAVFDDLMSHDALRELRAHQQRIDEDGRPSTPSKLRKTTAHRGSLGRTDPEFPHDQFTAAQISRQCALTRKTLGDADLYPQLKRAGLIATNLRYGKLLAQ